MKKMKLCLLVLFMNIQNVKSMCFWDIAGLYIVCRTVVRLYRPMNKPTDYVTIEEFRKLLSILQQNQLDIQLTKKQYVDLFKQVRELTDILKLKYADDIYLAQEVM